MNTMFENVIFDFGKVIVEFDPDTILKPYIADKTEREMLIPIVFDRIYWDKLDSGEIIEDDLYSAVEPLIDERLRSDVKLALDNWYFNLPVFHQTVDIINKLKSKGKRLFLLSNISRTFANEYKHVKTLDILSEFDGCVFSGNEGIVKPHREIFDLLIKRYSIEPSKSLFIDDNPVNIAGAENAGLSAFLFRNNYDDLKMVLNI